MLVAAFISSAVLFGADAMLSSDQAQPWQRSMLLAWACVALGLLSKGLIGIVLPAGVMLLWIVLQRRWSWLTKLLWWPGIVLSLSSSIIFSFTSISSDSPRPASTI
jgi:4-amino-4-deoxy-L-arabinose transferase-like glycosyltransferase